MTAEPVRDPKDETTSDPAAPGGAADPPPPAGNAPASSVDATVMEGSMPAPAVDAPASEAPATDAPNPVMAAAEAQAVAEPKPSRRPAIATALRRLALFIVAVALFAGGIAIGNYAFLRSRPAPIVPVDISTEAPPTVTQEFITALGSNDADALRSSLDSQPNKDLTGEFTRFDIKRITSVETLGTSVNGDRSATEILLRAEKSDGLPFEVNLVILVEGNKIEGFR